MTNRILIGQIVGGLAMVESFFIFQATNRRTMVILKLIDDVLWIVHFMLIGGFTGALTTTVALSRETVFYFKGKKKWATSILWAIGFSFAFAACAPLSWTGVLSIFPVTASVIATWVFWINKTEIAKLIQIPSVICSLIYVIAYSSYAGIIAQIITVVSIAVFFIRKTA